MLANHCLVVLRINKDMLPGKVTGYFHAGTTLLDLIDPIFFSMHMVSDLEFAIRIRATYRERSVPLVVVAGKAHANLLHALLSLASF